MAVFTGTSGADNFTGTAGNDTFYLFQGGDDTATGLGGRDVFVFGGAFTAADSVDGGALNDVLRLAGDYSGGVTFGASTMTSVEVIQLGAGFSYNLATNDANIAFNAVLRVEGSLLDASHSLTFDGSAESDGRFLITDGLGSDTLTGGARTDKFVLSGGEDIVHGGGGNDSIDMQGSLDANDQIDGGAGTNNLADLDGDYSAGLTFGETTLLNIQTLVLEAGHSYKLTTADNTTVHGKIFTIDASALGTSDVLTLTMNPTSPGGYDVLAGAGNDVITNLAVANPASGSNAYDLSKGGIDHATGGANNDEFTMGATLTAADKIDGGAGGNDAIILDGDYSGANALVLSSGTIANITRFQLDPGSNYDITLANGNVAAGATMSVLTGPGSGNVHFDASALTSGAIDFSGGSGTDTTIGGAGNDIFNDNGGTVTFTGNGGNDTFFMENHFDPGDTIDGGAGNDIVDIANSTTIVLGATSMTSVETVEFGLNASATVYSFTTNDASVAAGAGLTVRDLGSGDTVTFNGAAETDGHFHFINGVNTHDTFIGGAQSDVFELQRRAPVTATGGGGADTFTAATPVTASIHDTLVYNAVSDSTSTTFDTIKVWNFSADILHVSPVGAVTGIDAAVTAGSLSSATFDSDLATDVGAGQLAAHHAMLFAANAGTLSGHTFLVVDENGTAGYQAGGDLVMDVTGATGTLSTGSFA